MCTITKGFSARTKANAAPDVILVCKALTHCLMEKPKLKKSKTLSINIHEIESNDFSKSIRRRIPGMSCSSVKCRMSYIRRVVSPIYLPGMRPV